MRQERGVGMNHSESWQAATRKCCMPGQLLWQLAMTAGVTSCKSRTGAVGASTLITPVFYTLTHILHSLPHLAHCQCKNSPCIMPLYQYLENISPSMVSQVQEVLAPVILISTVAVCGSFSTIFHAWIFKQWCSAGEVHRCGDAGQVLLSCSIFLVTILQCGEKT